MSPWFNGEHSRLRHRSKRVRTPFYVTVQHISHYASGTTLTLLYTFVHRSYYWTPLSYTHIFIVPKIVYTCALIKIRMNVVSCLNF